MRRYSPQETDERPDDYERSETPRQREARAIMRYQGVNQRGTPNVGMLRRGEVARFVQGKFEDGWSSLSVFAQTDSGKQEVGGICIDETGRRCCWWETDEV